MADMHEKEQEVFNNTIENILCNSSDIETNIDNCDNNKNEKTVDQEEFGGKGSIFSGFINLSNTLFGSGILSLPYAFAVSYNLF
eukprot:Pgem_evm1s13615